MIRVLADRVLVLLPPKESETTTESGLVLIKDPELRSQTRGIVVALGEKLGTVLIDDVMALFDETLASAEQPEDFRGGLIALKPAPFDVAVNDCVIFPASAGESIDDGGLHYVILHEYDIIGVLEPLSKTEAA